MLFVRMIEQYPSFGPKHTALFKMQRIQQAQVLEGGYEVVELISFELDYSLSPNFLIYFFLPSLPIPSFLTASLLHLCLSVRCGRGEEGVGGQEMRSVFN